MNHLGYSLGAVYFCENHKVYCCFVDSADVVWKSYDAVSGNVMLYLDAGFPQYGKVGERKRSSFTGPLTDAEADMQMMLDPNLDFTYWRKLYADRK